MKPGDICRVKNLAIYFYLGNPVIVFYNDINLNIARVCVALIPNKVYRKVALPDKNLEYIGSDDIVNYINIL